MAKMSKIAQTAASYLIDDGLQTPKVGPWAEEKYSLVRLYNELFSTGMKKIWDKRVYIDLFSGPGRARIRGVEKIISSSPLIALGVKDTYDAYVFCDEQRENIESLRTRIDILFC